MNLVSFGQMKIYTQKMDVISTGKIDFIDVTEKISGAVKKSKIKDGLINIYSVHTTTSIRINENEPRLLEDLKCFLEQEVPSCKNYLHDDIDKRQNVTEDEKINAHAHIKAILLGTSETVPLIKGKLLLGKWQSIFFVECDGPQKRQMYINILGE